MMAPMIFYKDVRIGLKHLLIVPAMFTLMYLAMKLIAEGHYGHVATQQEIGAISLVMLTTFNTFIAIVIGAQVMAEEKNAGTNLLLARLPISRGHLYTEKIVAGLSCVAILYAASLFYLSFLDLENAWKNSISFGTIPGNLAIAMFSAYAFAIALSRFTHQSIAILLVSFGAECLLWFAIAIIASTEAIDWYVIRVSGMFLLLFFVVPTILLWRKWQLPLHPALWGTTDQRTRLKGLIWKSFAENGLLHVMCLLLLSATLILVYSSSASIRHGDSIVGTCIVMMGVLLFAALGSSAYATNERKGLHCIAYYHPIPRGHLFAAKQLAALPSIVIVSLALVLTVSEVVPAVTVVVFAIFMYLQALQICLTYQTGTVIVILAAMICAWMVVGSIWAWMTPTDNALIVDGFTPVNDPYLVALIPLTLVTFGSLSSSWRLATDRRFLASSDVYRQRVSLVYFLVVGAITALVVSLIQEVVVL